MAFCRKCGSKLAGDALFCEICGVKIVHHPESDETPEATPANIIDVTEFPEMTADETITFCEKAFTDFKSLERLDQEIADNNRKLSAAPHYTNAQFSTFHFFWPYLIIAAVSLFVFYILAIIIVTNSRNPSVFVAFLPIIAFGGVLIFGGIRASGKRDKANYGLSVQNSEEQTRRSKMRNETASLKEKRNDLYKKLAEKYNWLPKRYRTSSCMKRAANLLKAGKASDLKSALKQLK